MTIHQRLFGRAPDIGVRVVKQRKEHIKGRTLVELSKEIQADLPSNWMRIVQTGDCRPGWKSSRAMFQREMCASGKFLIFRIQRVQQQLCDLFVGHFKI